MRVHDFGLAVGAALGAPLEFMPRLEVRICSPSGLRDMVASNLWEEGNIPTITPHGGDYVHDISPTSVSASSTITWEFELPLYYWHQRLGNCRQVRIRLFPVAYGSL